jgi:uncharacterized membrane-anchored protein
MELKESSASERVLLVIACVITTVWAVATIIQVAFPTRVVPEYANLAMMVVAGSFFTGSVVTSRRANKNGSDT